MGKYLGPEIEYCWVDKWGLQWNVPIEDGGEVVGYNHNIVLHYILQDAGKKKVHESQKKVSLKTSEAMLTVAEMGALMETKEIQDKISGAIADLKEEFAGYTG